LNIKSSTCSCRFNITERSFPYRTSLLYGRIR